MDEKPVIAAFDFDGTLTWIDTLPLFFFLAVNPLKAFSSLCKLTPDLFHYARGSFSREQLKERALTLFFKGIPESYLQERACAFATCLSLFITKTRMAPLLRHLKQGHRCILVSANLELALCPWAIANHFTDVIATLCAVDSEGKLTGKLQGPNCWGKEKQRRLEELLGDRENYTLYAYGDSRGDSELLAFADYAFYRGISLDLFRN